MDVIIKALEIFRDLVDSLECECDPYHGYTCPLHNNRILARKALAQIAAQPHCRAAFMEKMTDKEKKAYEWALNQKHQSVAADYARILANYIERTPQPPVEVERCRFCGDEIVGKCINGCGYFPTKRG